MTTTSPDGIQRAAFAIDGGKYGPSVDTVERSKPVELTFDGRKELGCGGTVVFKSLSMSNELESGKTFTSNLTPHEAGEVAFAYGMGMFDGKVVVNAPQGT